MSKLFNITALLSAASALVMLSCTTDIEQVVPSTKVDAAAQKIIHTPDEGADDALLVYVDKATAEAIDANTDNALSAMAATLGAHSVSHAVDMACDVERRKSYGLDRWFVVRFDEDADIENAAMQLASVKEINRVQYVVKPVYPKFNPVKLDISKVATTRADEARFNDPSLPMQWHYKNTGNTEIYPTAKAGADANVDAAWALTAGRNDVIVAVVDEGVDYTHEDLNANMLANEAELNGAEGVDDDGNGYVDDTYGYNFVVGGPVSWTLPNDLGHGTHVAGTVAAVNNNGIGVAGVAGGTGKGDGVRMLSCQVFSNSKEATVENVANAILYAADMGASVLQCSWNFSPMLYSNDADFESKLSLEAEALRYFIDKSNCAAMKGGIVIFASGNQGVNVSGYPGAYRDFISVTAFSPDGLPAFYTNYDKGCNVAAPGGELEDGLETGGVLSTLPDNNYGFQQGTSMACPHVSGIAALALSYALDNGYTLTTEELNSIILTSVNNIDSSLSGYHVTPEGARISLKTYQSKMGTGMVDAYRVLMAIRGTQCIPVPLGEEATIAINNYLGDGKLSVKVVRDDFRLPDDVCEKLGVVGTPTITANNNLIIHCTKPGCALITLGFVAGGKTLGDDDSIGGKYIEKEFALIVREGNTAPRGFL